MSPEYEKALADHSVALKARGAAARAYRERRIGDAEYLAAAEAMRAADAVLDEAFRAEELREDERAKAALREELLVGYTGETFVFPTNSPEDRLRMQDMPSEDPE